MSRVLMRAILLLGAALCVLPAQAERPISLDQAVSEARERYPGRVLSAETERRNGHERHRIRILTDDGQVKRLDIDPDSGHRIQRPPQR